MGVTSFGYNFGSIARTTYAPRRPEPIPINTGTAKGSASAPCPTEMRPIAKSKPKETDGIIARRTSPLLQTVAYTAPPVRPATTKFKPRRAIPEGSPGRFRLTKYCTNANAKKKDTMLARIDAITTIARLIMLAIIIACCAEPPDAVVPYI